MAMRFESFSDVFFWQSMNDRDWYDDEFYSDATYGLKRVFYRDTPDAFTVSMQRSMASTSTSGRAPSWMATSS